MPRAEDAFDPTSNHGDRESVRNAGSHAAVASPRLGHCSMCPLAMRRPWHRAAVRSMVILGRFATDFKTVTPLDASPDS
jgi:hypothetical protein